MVTNKVLYLVTHPWHVISSLPARLIAPLYTNFKLPLLHTVQGSRLLFITFSKDDNGRIICWPIAGILEFLLGTGYVGRLEDSDCND